MNDDREYWNGLAIIVGAAAALCAALLDGIVAIEALLGI